MLISVIIAVLVSVFFCMSAIGVSSAVNKIYKGKEEILNRYECGFVNSEDIYFFDKKMLFIAPFIIIEMMVMWILFYGMMSVYLGIYVHYVCLFLFFTVFVLCLIYSQQKTTI